MRLRVYLDHEDEQAIVDIDATRARVEYEDADGNVLRLVDEGDGQRLCASSPNALVAVPGLVARTLTLRAGQFR